MTTDPQEWRPRVEAIMEEMTDRAIELKGEPRRMAAVVSEMHFIKKMIADIDKDGTGTIDFQEFLGMMTSKMVRCSCLSHHILFLLSH